MKTILLLIWTAFSPVLIRMLTSLKFWTTMLGIAATYLAHKGIVLDPEMAQYVALFFSMLLGGQALADHGKEKAKLEVARDVAYMNAPTVKDAETPPPSTATQGGFARFDALLICFVTGFVVFSVALTACTWLKGETKHVASNIIDCSTAKAKAALTEFKPMAEQFVLDSLDNMGKPDTSRLTTIAKSLKAEVGGCVMQAAIDEVLSLATKGAVGVMSEPVQVDSAALSDAWAQVRQTQYGGRSFQ